jgi:hypothetical protein
MIAQFLYFSSTASTDVVFRCNWEFLAFYWLALRVYWDKMLAKNYSVVWLRAVRASVVEVFAITLVPNSLLTEKHIAFLASIWIEVGTFFTDCKPATRFRTLSSFFRLFQDFLCLFPVTTYLAMSGIFQVLSATHTLTVFYSWKT